MENPEVRFYVAQYLNTRDLASATLVCKNWKTTFTPFLYAIVDWHTSTISGSASALKKQVSSQKYADHVREMTLHINLPSRINVIVGPNSFTRLEKIKLKYPGYRAELWKWTTNFLSRNPGLIDLHLDFRSDKDPFSREYVETLSRSCSRLKKLHISQGVWDPQDMRLLFRNMGETLEELSLNRISLHSHIAKSKKTKGNITDMWLSIQLPKVKTLTLLDLKIPTLQQINIIDMCLDIRSLYWHIELKYDFPLLVSKILAARCSKVVKLKLSGIRLSDSDLATVMEGIQPGLSEISLSESYFGGLALKPLLRKQAASLTRLSIVCHGTLSSAMAQRILTTCPHLVEFSVELIKAQDILGITENDSSSDEDGEEDEKENGGEGEDEGEEEEMKDWVCTKLVSFSAFICGLRGKPLDWHRGVYRQISRLERLEELYVCPGTEFKDLVPPYIFKDKAIWDGLKVQRAAGLEKLSTLKELKEFSFIDLEQEIEEDDVRWMIKSWPKLEGVYGKLNEDRDLFIKMAMILKASDIDTTVDDIEDSEEDEEYEMDKFEQLYWSERR
ncbi:hypothetical protein BGZ46_004622 [Entomortierella lignicola]|nr:hypothetical protein BGZ46_004622 [Entomortierella lignicola]